jgi:deoxyribose-phosphate aldolase
MEINRMIDHTILKADATKDDVMKIIEEAKKNIVSILSASILHG